MSPSPTIPQSPVAAGRRPRLPRLIFVNRYFHPDHSATAQILTDLCFFLAAAGWTVEVVTSRRLYGGAGAKLAPRETTNGVSIRRVWTSDFGRQTLVGRGFDYLTFYLTAFFTLLFICRRSDLVIAKTDPPLVSLAAGPAVALRGGRLINWLQDLYPEIAAQLGVGPLNGSLGTMLRRLRNRSLRSAVVNVAIGLKMRERILGEGASAERVAVIPNWTNDQDIQPEPVGDSTLRQAWGFAADDFVVGYSGNLGRAHEVETLLAAARLLRTRTDIKFLFVGGGHYGDRLSKIAEAEGLTSFEFRPYQLKEHLSQALAVPDIHWVSLRPELEGLVLPSKFYGIAAAARPLITIVDPAGELAELVREHGCGVVIAPGDGEALASALEELSADRAACLRMGADARGMLEARFTRAASLARWNELLTAVAPHH